MCQNNVSYYIRAKKSSSSNIFKQEHEKRERRKEKGAETHDNGGTVLSMGANPKAAGALNTHDNF